METIVYIADTEPLCDASRFAWLYEQMPVWRRQKIDALSSPEKKRLSLGAGVLLYRALSASAESGSPGTGDGRMLAAKIAFGKNGKPYFEEYPAVQFSLSHSGRFCMAAISPQAIGCDVEQERGDDLSLAKRFFTPEEYDFLAASGTAARAFARLWTRKESYMKALGEGFALPMSDFSSLADPPGFCYTELSMPAGYAGCVCHAQGTTCGTQWVKL